MLSLLKWLLGFLLALVVLLAAFLYFGTFHPPQIKSEKIITHSESAQIRTGQKLKVLSWNVQFMASKDYIFFYEGGASQAPSPTAVQQTLEAVARVIIQENPDIILLQEVDDGAKRTQYQDQLADLLQLLPADYKNHSSSFYWKTSFVPHPEIMGKVGMKLSVIAKYQINGAIRHQLPLIQRENLAWYQIPYFWLRQQLNIKRAVQEVSLPIREGGNLLVFNTHLSAFAQGTNTLREQVEELLRLLQEKTREQVPWLIGGDFNLLPPGRAYRELAPSFQALYRPDTELAMLYDLYQAVPSLEETNGPARRDWYTHFPNHSGVKAPDRTIDYLFFSDQLLLQAHRVRQKDTWSISDHLPVIAEFVVE